MNNLSRLYRLCLLFILVSVLGGCAMVQIQSLDKGDYIAAKRGDILTTNNISQASLEALQVLGLNEDSCRREMEQCFQSLAQSSGLTNERRLVTLSELWLQQAIALTPKGQAPQSDEALNAYLEAARHAYAYLFFSERTPGQRAFEERQTQVRDYYNFSAQQVLTGLFSRYTNPTERAELAMRDSMQVGDWFIVRDMSDIQVGKSDTMPLEVLSASSLRFAGLRNTYRRDGFGAELVAVMDRPVPTYLLTEEGNIQGNKRSKEGQRVFSEMSARSLTALIHFRGKTLDEVLSTRRLRLIGYDPYAKSVVQIHGQEVPLAANFTAAYGLWLARSDFATQSLRTLLGHERGINSPHIYMMQPYDPNRKIVLMLHGLASSPEAWVNVANEVLGDEQLRKHYQIWQVYYPTNIPIVVNHQHIREALTQTLKYVDSKGIAPASNEMVLLGHSMGGIIARLMISTANEDHWNALFKERELSQDQIIRIQERLGSLIYFEPMPQVNRAIFIATPHSGTSIASNRIVRWVSNLVRLPETLLRNFEDVVHTLPKEKRGEYNRIPNSIDNLRDTDPFIRISATLPISPDVPYHSIIARRSPGGPLIDSDDGVVPYKSAHLPGAQSEKIIISGHSVQETPQAILEIRRILHLHLQGTKVRKD